MKITKQLILPTALLFMLAHARGQDIHYSYDRGANFQSYRTYQWVDVSKGPAGPSKTGVSVGLPDLPIGPPPMSGINVSDDQLLDQDIKRAVDAQLAEKGLTKVDKGGDILVSYQAHVREEKGINLWGSGANGGWGGDPWGAGLNSVQGQTSTIPIGTLVVGLYDPARKQLIWRGDASKTVNLKKDPNKNYANLQKAMVKLFKNYPPQPGR
jgi:Domain of unknown function (DUF4136)